MTLLVLAGIIGMAVAFRFHRDKLGADQLLTRGLEQHPLEWWRALVSIFVFGWHQEIVCIFACGLIFRAGIATERAFGGGATLLALLVGGAAGNLVRCGFEPAESLSNLGGGLIAGVALSGCAVSAVARAGFQPVGTALRGYLVSCLLALLFPVLPALEHQGAKPFTDLLPGAGAGFLVGGFLGSLWPLRTSRRSGTAAALWLAALAVFALGAVPYARQVLPKLRSGEATGAPHTRTVSDAKLGMDFRVPDYLRAVSGKDGETVYRPAFGGTPALVVRTEPRDPSALGAFAADTLTETLAERYRAEQPGLQALSRGPIRDCPTGAGYRVVLQGHASSAEIRLVLATVEAHSKFVLITLFADPEDATAEALVDEVARSLKPRRVPTDKKE